MLIQIPHAKVLEVQQSLRPLGIRYRVGYRLIGPDPEDIHPIFISDLTPGDNHVAEIQDTALIDNGGDEERLETIVAILKEHGTVLEPPDLQAAKKRLSRAETRRIRRP